MLRIVKKREVVEDKICYLPKDAGYAWDTQWKIDDLRSIPRIIRGVQYIGAYFDRKLRAKSLPHKTV